MTKEQGLITASIGKAAEAYQEALNKGDFTGAECITRGIGILTDALYTLGKVMPGLRQTEEHEG